MVCKLAHLHWIGRLCIWSTPKIWPKWRLLIGRELRMLASHWSRGPWENFQRGYTYNHECVPIERYWPQITLDWFISGLAILAIRRGVGWSVVSLYGIWLDVNWHLIGCYFTSDWMSIGIWLRFNWHHIGSQLAFDWHSSDLRFYLNWNQIGCWLASNW